jgi:hypothetical protein
MRISVIFLVLFFSNWSYCQRRAESNVEVKNYQKDKSKNYWSLKLGINFTQPNGLQIPVGNESYFSTSDNAELQNIDFSIGIAYTSHRHTIELDFGTLTPSFGFRYNLSKDFNNQLETKGFNSISSTFYAPIRYSYDILSFKPKLSLNLGIGVGLIFIPKSEDRFQIEDFSYVRNLQSTTFGSDLTFKLNYNLSSKTIVSFFYKYVYSPKNIWEVDLIAVPNPITLKSNLNSRQIGIQLLFNLKK